MECPKAHDSEVPIKAVIMLFIYVMYHIVFQQCIVICVVLRSVAR